jgi:hypothetical protein
MGGVERSSALSVVAVGSRTGGALEDCCNVEMMVSLIF